MIEYVFTPWREIEIGRVYTITIGGPLRVKLAEEYGRFGDVYSVESRSVQDFIAKTKAVRS